MRSQAAFDLRYKVVSYTAAEVLTFHSARKVLVQSIPGGQAATYLTGSEADPAAPAGKSLVTGTAGNVDYTSGGSPIVLVLAYRIIPVAGFRIAQLTDTSRPR